MRLADSIGKLQARVDTPADMLLLIRMGMWGAVIHVLKYVVPLPVLVRMVRLSPSLERLGEGAVAERDCEKIATFARWACRATQWSRKGRCLEQGLVSYRYLSKLNVDPYLVVGVRQEDGTRGARGHAWVEAGGRVIGEDGESVAPFTRVLTFDPAGEVLPDSAALAR